MVLHQQTYKQPDTMAHILVIDDDPSVNLLLQRILESHYRVTTVNNGEAGMACLALEPVDLVLTDIRMPRFTGFDVLTSIRDTPAYSDIPVILISGLADNADIARGLEMGANDYLTKPIDRRLTLARIRTQLMIKGLLDNHKQTIDELQAMQHMRDRFFHIASHDIKNPMNNIRMAQFLLRGMLDEDPSTDVLLDNIEIALDTMEDIVRDFLDMAAIQSKALDLHFAEVVVEDVLWEVVIQYNISAQKKDIIVKIDDAPGVIRADFRRLVQAISNLVSNAIKYSPRSTQVTLFTEQKADSVCILIRDEGPGIPPEERGQLFSEFGKLSTKPTDGEGRTGLGLWIVKQLVTLQGGTVGAEFPEEGGSIFWIELPAWTDAVAINLPNNIVVES